jgi:hypothetical protein
MICGGGDLAVGIEVCEARYSDEGGKREAVCTAAAIRIIVLSVPQDNR